MKHCLILGLLILFQPIRIFCSEKSIGNDPISKSINLNPAITIGTETGITFRLEYEKNNKGKILLNSAAGLYGKDEYYMLDIGLGYGYPILTSNNYKINLNGLCTYMYQFIPVGLPMDRHGITGLIELEFVKSWKNFSLNIAPTYRRLELKGLSSFADKNLKGYNSVAVRFGLTYRFKLKNRLKTT